MSNQPRGLVLLTPLQSHSLSQPTPASPSPVKPIAATSNGSPDTGPSPTWPRLFLMLPSNQAPPSSDPRAATDGALIPWQEHRALCALGPAVLRDRPSTRPVRPRPRSDAPVPLAPPPSLLGPRSHFPCPACDTCQVTSPPGDAPAPTPPSSTAVPRVCLSCLWLPYPVSQTEQAEGHKCILCGLEAEASLTGLSPSGRQHQLRLQHRTGEGLPAFAALSGCLGSLACGCDQVPSPICCLRHTAFSCPRPPSPFPL